MQDDAAEREAVCLSEDIVWWRGAEDVARSAQELGLPPDDDEHGENAEAGGHDGEAEDAKPPRRGMIVRFRQKMALQKGQSRQTMRPQDAGAEVPVRRESESRSACSNCLIEF